MTTEQINNLETLANYLLKGELKASFNMSDFSGNKFSLSLISGEGVNDCGTIGCAVGHGPFAGIPKLKDESWWEYAERVFGVHYYRFLNVPAWEWMFAGEWSEADNTAIGAAKRIKYFLSKGLPPEGTIESMMSDDSGLHSDMIDWYTENVLNAF